MWWTARVRKDIRYSFGESYVLALGMIVLGIVLCVITVQNSLGVGGWLFGLATLGFGIWMRWYLRTRSVEARRAKREAEAAIAIKEDDKPA